MTMVVLFLLGVTLPGFLLVDLCTLSDQKVPLPEKLLYAAGAGYGLFVAAMLLLSYIPGPIRLWHTIALYAVSVTVLLAAVGYSRNSFFRSPMKCEFAVPWRYRPHMTGHPKAGYILAIGVVVILAAYLRFAHLGYSELQGDEAAVALTADNMIRGYENALLTRLKGPAEVLLPALIYRLTGTLTEFQSRVPFAVASTLAVIGILMLGSRLFTPVAGIVAAAAVALDGYLIAFGRIMQYQSIVFFMVVLTVLVLYRLAREPENLTGLLLLAVLFSVTGALAHYEAAFVIIPGAYLLWLIGRQVGLNKLFRAAIIPAILGIALLALFYLPFVVNPAFGEVYRYLFGYRLGGAQVFDSLRDFYYRTTLYSTSYYLYLMIALAVAELTGVYLHTLPRRVRVPSVLAMLMLIVALLVYPAPITEVNHRFLGAIIALVIGIAWVSPRVKPEERLVWLWFGVTLIVSVFLTSRPGTHVYSTFIPWALLAGLSADHILRSASARFPQRPTNLVSYGVFGLVLLVFAVYAYELFVRNDVEVLRTWPEHHPRGYWTAYDMPVEIAIFGFPSRNGWNSIAAMYETGMLTGGFDTNIRPAVAEWYTRGRGPCARDDPEYFMLAHPVEPTLADEREEIRRGLEDKYELLATIEVNSEPRLEIFERTKAPIMPYVVDDAVYSAIARRNHLHDNFPRNGPTGKVRFPFSADYRLRNGMWLQGYDLSSAVVSPGEALDITLYWQATEKIPDDYFVSLQLIDLGDLRKAGQRDGEPGCNMYPTSSWIVGDVISDRYRVPIADDATEGQYTLLLTVYSQDSQVEYIDEAGNAAGISIPLAEIRVEAGPGE